MPNLGRQIKIDEQSSSIYDVKETMLESLLKNIGLTAGEAKVFLKTVELGPQPASHIAHLTGMPRNTVRSILDVLVKKGMMVKTRRANTQYYAAEGKENLIRQLKFRKVRTADEIDHQIELLETYGDELSAHQWAKSRPKITFYEGLSGMEKVYEDTLTSKESLKSWASYDGLLAAMPTYFYSYFKRRAEKGIAMQSIHPDTSAAREGQKRDKAERRRSALVPHEKFDWTPEIQVYDNKVNICSWKEKLGIIIESQEIADTLKVIFNLSYEAAEKYGKTTPPTKK